jgi:hypothetical protein
MIIANWATILSSFGKVLSPDALQIKIMLAQQAARL